MTAVSQRSAMKSAWAALFAAAVFWVNPAVAADSDVRFSHTLSAEEKTAAGLASFTSDEVAALDALVRRDTTVRLNATAAGESEPKPFSQRLSADEQRLTGIAKLATPEARARLDGFVARFQAAKLARTLLAPPRLVAKSRLTAEETKADPRKNIHGSFSLSMGWGKGGYSERTGAMELHYVDPDRNFGVSIGYSETHIKGGHGPLIYRDPFYDPTRPRLNPSLDPFEP